MLTKIIFGFLAVYLWLGIIFAIILLIRYRKLPAYQLYCNHILTTVLKWPLVSLIIIRLNFTLKQIKRLIKIKDKLYNDCKTKCLDTIYNKSLDIEERLDALVDLGDLEYIRNNFDQGTSINIGYINEEGNIIDIRDNL